MKEYLASIKHKIERRATLWNHRRKFRELDLKLDDMQKSHLETLRSDGIVLIPNALPSSVVDEMRDSVEQAINEGAFRAKKEVGFEIPESERSEIPRMNLIDTTLRSKAFIDLAVNSTYLPIIFSYLKFVPLISGVVAYRTNPVKTAPTGAFLWHYDNTPLQVKIMCYLTDVTSETGAFTYIKGSQQPYMSQAKNYSDTRIDESDVDRSREIICEGKAGSIVIVDTTGIHRGMPNKIAKRDVVVCIYDAGMRDRRECFYNLPIPDAVARSLSPSERRLLRLPKFMG